jgi:hypothetical protein
MNVVSPSVEERYAEALLRTGDAFAAARSLGYGPGEAHAIAETWPNKFDVICAKAALVEKYGEEYFLPNKAEICRKALRIEQEAPDASDKLNALTFYAKLRGMIVDQSKSDNTIEVVVRGVAEREKERLARIGDGKTYDVEVVKS